jgi:hypothetical protein
MNLTGQANRRAGRRKIPGKPAALPLLPGTMSLHDGRDYGRRLDPGGLSPEIKQLEKRGLLFATLDHHLCL